MSPAAGVNSVDAGILHFNTHKFLLDSIQLKVAMKVYLLHINLDEVEV